MNYLCVNFTTVEFATIKTFYSPSSFVLEDNQTKFGISESKDQCFMCGFHALRENALIENASNATGTSHSFPQLMNDFDVY